MKTFKSILALSAVIFAISSCKKDDPEPVVNPGTVSVHMEHIWGPNEDPFYLDSMYVHPMSGDTLMFTTTKYYISNFKLKDENGTWHAMSDSYFLVDLSNPSSLDLNLGNFPAGTYTEMSYVLGVDSLRNVSGAQSGALAPSNGMFWSWNSGYIMFKLEGMSPQASGGMFTYHIGGFSGANNVVETKNHVFPTPMTLDASGSRMIHLTANIAKAFHTLGSVANNNMIHMPGATGTQMGVDFHTGFNFEHFH